MLCDDVLIKNNKYGWVSMQNNGSMKTVNFTHAITAETRHSFLPFMNAEYEAKASNRTYTIWCNVNTTVFV